VNITEAARTAAVTIAQSGRMYAAKGLDAGTGLLPNSVAAPRPPAAIATLVTP